MASLFRRKRAGSADPELEWVAGESTPVDDPPTAQSDLEDSSPLAERLATMQWPTPPEDVRERCLREIMNRVGQDLPNEASNADDRTAEDRRAAG